MCTLTYYVGGYSFIFLWFITVISVTCQPYVSVDWTLAESGINGVKIEAYTVDYFPAIGKPPAPIRLPTTASQMVVTDTLPATMYTVGVVAELADGHRSIIFNATLPSSPEPPLVDKVDSKTDEIVIQLFPSDIDDVTYAANYSLVSKPETQFYQSFLEPSVRLMNLNANSEYDIFIHSVFNGVYSHIPYHTTVRTRPSYATDGQSLALIVSSISISMTTTSEIVQSSTVISTTGSVTAEESTADQTTASTWSLETTPLDATSSFDTTASSSTQVTTTLEPSSTASEEGLQSTVAETSLVTYHLTQASTNAQTQPSVSAMPRIPHALMKQTTSTTPSGNIGQDETTADGETREYESDVATSLEPDEESESEISRRVTTRIKGKQKIVKMPTVHSSKPPNPAHSFTFSRPPDEIMASWPDSYGRPRSVDCTPEGRQLRVTWKRPEGVQCTGYLLNYTLTTLHTPKSFQLNIEGNRTYALIKMFLNNIIEVEVYCLINISSHQLVSKTPGQVTIDLRKPDPVRNLRVAGILTDAFFRSSIVLEWDWPSNTTDAYSLVVSYYPGKAKKLKSQTVTVNDTGPLNITGLKATEMYTFTVKNISRLNIQSAAVGLKQTMPPIVSSTLLPGRVTSTSLLITYSPTDVDEALFDSYHLVACFSETVNRTFIKAKADSNRNFLLKNLIPGQTYTFYLYTVYKKVRSMPIIANFTTYPLKVKRLFSIVRRNAIKLFYEPEDSPFKEIRYKLSFTGSDGSESDSVTVLNQREYVFDYLKPEIWYTFSITVLMGDQESESTSKTIVTGLSSDPVPHVRGGSPTSIDIAFRRDFFTESNGIVQNYSIIVAEDYRLDYFNYSTLSWKSVQNNEIWPPYRATPASYNPFKNPREEATTYTIGIDTCKIDDPDEFCNGPLKPHTVYFIKLRACTNEDICMETSYTKAATEKDTTPLEFRKFLNSPYYSAGDRATHHVGKSLVLTTLLLSIYCILSLN